MNISENAKTKATDYEMYPLKWVVQPVASEHTCENVDLNGVNYSMNQLNQEIMAIRNQISQYDTILSFEDLSSEYRRNIETKKEKLQDELNLRLDQLRG